MNRNPFIIGVAIILVVLPLLTAFAQTPAPSKQQDQTVQIGTIEIPLDIVVRDKKGRPVRDLTAADFEVFEDGVKQKIESFRLVAREAKKTDVTKKIEGENTTGKQVETTSLGVTALVFDRLTPEARALAHKAALAYAQENASPQDYTGVFAIDLSLRTVQQYTNDPQLVSKAVEQVSSSVASTFTSGAERVRTLADQSTALQNSADQSVSSMGATGPGGGGSNAPSSPPGGAMTQLALNEMQSRMLQSYETLERDQQGHATVNALLAVIDSMRSLPGRKSIVFFSEGLSLPPAVLNQFNSVISAANRANIAIYSIDAAGLRLESTTLETTNEINSLAQKRMQQVGRGKDDGSGPLMKSLERNEDLLRLNPHSGLGQLSDQTGGFLVKDTNDLSAGIRRIDEDMHIHYMLTYAPKNRDFDGKFRHIEVKLARPNLDVQARKGYYALSLASNSPILEYEVPAFAALSKSTPNPFGLLVLGTSFPEPKHPGLVPIVASVPSTSFTFTPESEKKTYSTNFSIVTVIKDSSKQIVQKMSQNYVLSGPLDRIEAARKEPVFFYREIELAPGSYTIESVAYDVPSGKASLRVSSVEVPSTDDTKLRLSSLVLLQHAERMTAQEAKIDSPFHIGEVIVYPNLGESVHKAAVKQLAFFFTAWPEKGSTEPLKLTIDLSQNGKSLGQIPMDLKAADEKGRIQYASALPIDNFRPGTYELRVTVKDSKNSVSRSTSFTIEQ